MASDRAKPLAPSKAGTLPKGLSLVYSAELLKAAVESASVLTSSSSKSLCLAATRIAMVRGLSYW